MASNSVLESCTRVLVRNLPERIDCRFLEGYFRGCLRITTCQVTVIHDIASKLSKEMALIELKSTEKAHQAVRELSGAEIDGKHIQVSLYTNPFPLPPEYTVHLEGFPDGVNKSDVYDFFSRFGTIVSWITTYQSTEKQQGLSACITYLTKEEAQNVIQLVNNNKIIAASIVATLGSPDIIDGTAPPESMDATNAKKSDTNAEQEIFPVMEEHVITDHPQPQVEAIPVAAHVDMPTKNGGTDGKSMPKKPSYHPWKIQQKEKRYEVATVLTKPSESNAALESYEFKRTVDAHTNWTEVSVNEKGDIFQENKQPENVTHLLKSETVQMVKQKDSTLDLTSISSEEKRKEVAYDYLLSQYEKKIKPRARLERILTVLKDSLEPQHMLDNCMEKKRFQLYTGMSEAALSDGKSTIIQLSVQALADAESIVFRTSEDKRLQEICGSVFYSAFQVYSPDVSKKVLSMLLGSMSIYALLQLLLDQKQLRLNVFYAKVAFSNSIKGIQPPLPSVLEELILMLDLDKLDTTEQWKNVVRNRLMGSYRERYERDHLVKILDKILNSCNVSMGLFELLELCINEKCFRLLAFHANFAIRINADLVQRSLSDAIENFILQKGLDILYTNAALKQALYEYLLHEHGNRYEREHLARVLHTIFYSVSFPNDYYCLLQLCIDASRFDVHAAIAEYAIEYNTPFKCEILSDEVMTLVHQLGLLRLDSINAWKQPLREHSIELHEEQFVKDRLGRILHKVLTSLVYPSDYFGLLEMCADTKRFCVYALMAEYTLDFKSHFTFRPVSDAAAEMVWSIEVYKPSRVEHWLHPIINYLTRTQTGRFGATQLKNSVPALISSIVSLSAFYNFLEVCADSKKFSVYVVMTQFAAHLRCPFHYRPVSDAVEVLVWKLGLYRESSCDETKNALRLHITETYRKYYHKKQFPQVIGVVFQKVKSLDDHYRLLEIAANPSQFFEYVRRETNRAPNH